MASAMADGDVGISWLPLYHDMGLIGGLFTTMYWNMPIVLMKPEAFLFRPQWWMENIGRYKVTMGVAPNFGYHYCVTRISDEDLHRIDLRTWRLALNGAEPIDITLTSSSISFAHAASGTTCFCQWDGRTAWRRSRLTIPRSSGASTGRCSGRSTWPRFGLRGLGLHRPRCGRLSPARAGDQDC